jgi:hypothetical protein
MWYRMFTHPIFWDCVESNLPRKLFATLPEETYHLLPFTETKNLTMNTGNPG